MFNLLPRDEKYFERFTELAVRIHEAARILERYFLGQAEVSAVADHTEFRDVAKVDVSMDRSIDLVMLHDHRHAAAWPGRYTESEGYLLGLLVGDGTLKSDKAVLSAWPGRLVANGGVEERDTERAADSV